MQAPSMRLRSAQSFDQNGRGVFTFTLFEVEVRPLIPIGYFSPENLGCDYGSRSLIWDSRQLKIGHKP
jgi:hypothetical protein